MLALLADPAAAKSGDPQPSQSIFGNYLAARHAQIERKTRAAAELYLAALKKDPENPDLLVRTFGLLASDGRFDQALPLARKLSKTTGRRAELANLVLAMEQIKKGNFKSVKETLDGLPATGINLFVLPLLNAWTLVGLKDVEAALALLKKGSSNSGIAVLNGLHAGLIEAHAGRQAAAEKRFRALAKKRQIPDLRLTHYLGTLLERAGKPGEARAVYKKYLERRPDTTMLDDALARLKRGHRPGVFLASVRNGMAEAFFSLAGATRRQGPDETMLFVRLALYLRPDFQIARLLLAETLESDNRLEDAIAAYESVDGESHFSWTARLRIAGNLDQMGKTGKAVAMLGKMADERPARYDALVSLGDIQRRHERYREAAKAYTRTKERLTKIEARHWTLFYSSGIAFERLKEWPKAEVDFLKALDLQPDHPSVLNYLGYSWVELGRNLKRARKMIEKAVARRPRDGYIVDSLGWVLHRLGDLKGAVKQLERAVELRPEDPTINDHLGDVYWKAKRRTEARFQWQRALTLEPNKEDIPKINKKLKQGLPEKRKP